MWSAVYKSRFHLEWFACVWVGGRAYDRVRVCIVPGWTGQGWDVWVCVHKGRLVRTPVPFKSRVNRSVNTVREVGGEERQDVSRPWGCAEVLQLSGNICYIREKLSKHIFCPWLKALQACFCPTQNHHFELFLFNELSWMMLWYAQGSYRASIYREVLRKRDFCIRDSSWLLTPRKMGTDRLDQISRPSRSTLWPQTMLHHSF